MRTLTRVAVTFLVAALAACGPSTTGKNKAPEGNIPLGQLPETVEPVRYRLDLTIEPTKPGFGGVVEIDVALKAPTHQIYLHGRQLKVSDAAARLPDGTAVAAKYTELDDTGVAALVFDSELPKGEATLKLTYTTPFETTPDALTSQADSGDKYAWTQFEEISARRAFPSFDEPRFKTPYDITITARSTDVAIANTHVIKEESLSGGLKKTTFATTKPLPTYLVALIVGPYDVEEGPTLPAAGGRQYHIPVRGVTVKGKGPRSRYALQETPPLLRYLENYFATPYPYSKLDLVAPPNFTAGGMENAGAITYTERGILLDDSASIQQKRYFALLHAHEVAHQWFGDLVTPKWWDDIWLNESFATWMGNKAAANVWPENEFARETIRDALDVMDTDALSTARAIRQPIKSTDDIFNAFDGLTYDKGGAVLAMFESYLGEAPFREGVRNHIRRFAHKNANVHDFMESLAQGSGKPEVVPAFESFLNQPGVPLVRVKTTCSDRDLIVELQQAPFGAKDATDARRWQIPVCMRDVTRGSYRSCTMLSESTARITAPRQCGATLMPNADGAGYYRFTMATADWTKLTASLPQLSHAEQMATLHSLRAAFRAGDADATSYLTALKTTATNGAWDVRALAGGFLNELRGNLLSKNDIPVFEQKLRSWLLPGGKPVSFDAPRREPRAATLGRAELAELLAKTAHDPGTLTALAAKGATYFRELAQGKPLTQIAPELLPAALWSAVATGGAPVAHDAMSAIKVSSEAEFRTLAITALTAARDAAANQEIEQFIISGALSVRETGFYLRTAFADPDRRPGVWNWLRADFKRIAAVFPRDSRARLVGLSGKLCGDQSRTEMEWFYKPIIGPIAGAPRVYANALESVDRCVAWRKSKATELSTALRQL